MKKSNKGFVLLETLIVSTFILGTLVFLYVEFSSVKNAYDVSFRYNTVTGLYHAKELSDFLKIDGYQKIETQLANNDYVDITNCIYSGSLCKAITREINTKKILFAGESLQTLQNNLNSNSYDKTIFDPEFRKFILNLTPNTPGRKRLIIEYNDSTFTSISVGTDQTNNS